MSPTRPPSTRIRTGAALMALVLAGCTGPLASGADRNEAADDAAAGRTSGHHGPGECAGAHEGQPALGTEHCDAMALADPGNATHVAVASGPWSDAATWQDGAVPDDGAAIHVPAGVQVTIDSLLTETVDTVRVDGTLRFDPETDTELRVDTLVGSPASTFEMGTPERPITPDVTATIVVADRGPIDTARDPSQLGRGLVLHGKVVVQGTDRTDWIELADAPAAGDDRLTLTADAAGWRVGDRLAVAGVRPDGTGDEEVTVAAVEGATVTLEAALAEDHRSPRADLPVHVANLTRNAVVRSESTDLDRRGHVMFMHTRDVQVANAGFYDLGRTDKSHQLADLLYDDDASRSCAAPLPVTNPRARYSVHFHRNGVADDGNPATVTGSVVQGNPGWGYVNHSSNVDFVDNVAYDIGGAAYNTEVGDEVGSFEDNISIRTYGPAGIPAGGEQPTIRRNTQDFGWEGHGFWLQGPSVRLDGNVAAGATGAGIMVYAEALTEPVVGRAAFEAEDGPPLPVSQQQLAGVTDSTTYGSVTGLWIYYHRTGITLDPAEIRRLRDSPPDLPLSVVDGVRSYANVTGVRANYTVDTEFRDVTIVAPGPEAEDLLRSEEARDQFVGFDASNVYNHGVHRYIDFDIEGYPVGLLPSPGGEVTVEGGRFDNDEVDIAVTPARQEDRLLTISGLPSFPGADADGRTRIAADGTPITVVDSDETWYQLQDRIILDLDGAEPRQLFYDEQRPDVVPFPEQPEIAEPDDPGEPVPEEHIGLTNAELVHQGGPFAGSLVAEDAVPQPGLDGLVGTPHARPELTLDAGDVLVNLLDGEDVEDDEDVTGAPESVSATCDAEAMELLDEVLAESGEEAAELAAEADEGQEAEDVDGEQRPEGDESQDEELDERGESDEGREGDRDDHEEE